MPAPRHSIFHRPDALPDAKPTVSKHSRQEKRNENLKKLQQFTPGNVKAKLDLN